MADPLEDLIAILYTTGKLPSTTTNDDDVCPNCGADLIDDHLSGGKKCPECT